MRSVRKWAAISKNDLSQYKDLLNLSEDVGVFNHHDSITGTAKRYVDDDYMQRMTNIEDSVNKIFSGSFS